MTFTDLKSQLDASSNGNAANFDPVRFAFMQGVFSRSQTDGSAYGLARIKAVVDQYLSDLLEQKKVAKNRLFELRAQYPEQAELAQNLYEQCKFKSLERLLKRLNRLRESVEQLDELKALNNELQAPVEQASTKVASSFDEELLQQEQESLAEAGEISPEKTVHEGRLNDLKSMKDLRESMRHAGVDQLISRALNQHPENPGPLNPHMLALKALSQMQELSPVYLRRFASHLETYLWLEKMQGKLSKK